MAKLVSFFLRPFIVAADMVEKAVLHGLAPAHRPQDCGFVFATTGALYTVLARRAARTLRKSMPDAQIDLFTDQVLDDPVFTQIHRLRTSSSRPKMEAMRRSRFGKTVYLDADIVVLADVSELFALLDRVEFAACQGVARNNDFMGDGIIPRAFPMLNSGVLVFRNCRRTRTFLMEWERRVVSNQRRRDQGSLRNAVYDSNISYTVLPPEYNLIYMPMLDIWTEKMGAPRILHVTKLHETDPGNPLEPLDAMKLISPRQGARLADLLKDDAFLQAGPGTLRAPATASGGSVWKRGIRRWLGRWDPML